MNQPPALESRWEHCRQQMPVTRDLVYFDHAAVAPLSRPACEAIAAWANQAAFVGDVAWPEWATQVEKTRQLCAELLNASTEEIALVPNTTAGISQVAEGFPWRDGDNVVTLANEFPSNMYPWLHLASRGVETRRVPVENGTVDLNRIAETCDERTRIIAASWVGYSSGWRIDVDQLVELAHTRGALFFLDAIQGLGVFPLDVQQTAVDFLAADGHKWLLGPEGAGLLYVRREHLTALRPTSVGWHSVVHTHDFSRLELNLRSDAARFEAGTQNMVGFIGFGASLELLRTLGTGPKQAAIGDRVLQLTDLACERLMAAGAHLVSCRADEHRSGIVSFHIPNRDPNIVRRHCLDSGVVLSCRAGALRISPHAYNNEEDIERFIQSLRL